MLWYRALMSSLCASIASESLFISLMVESGLRPAFSFTSLWNEHMPEASTRLCCASMLNRKLWNRRAALGLDAVLKTALGAMMSGVPSPAIDNFHRRTTFSQQQKLGVGTVGLHGTLAVGKPVRRIAR